MKIDIQQVTDYFNSYVADYDMTNVKIELKVRHTFRVAEIAERIAVSIDADRDTAWLLGMLHDVGRFEQIRVYNTFVDADSVNHAALSADILFNDGLIRRFITDSSEDNLLERAIRLHNVYELPESLSERERTFCCILRDADKTDIFRVNWETPMNELYNTPVREFYEAPVSPDVINDFLNRRNVNRCHKKTAVDTLIGHISLIFGVVYPESFRIIKEQGYLDKLLAFRSSNPETQKSMELLNKIVHEYI